MGAEPGHVALTEISTGLVLVVGAAAKRDALDRMDLRAGPRIAVMELEELPSSAEMAAG